jgi:hypothetical protein
VRVFLVLIAGCAVSFAEFSRRSTKAAESNAQARDAAAAEMLATGSAFEPVELDLYESSATGPTSPNAQPADVVTAPHDLDGERLLRIADDTLAITGETCAHGDSCGCDVWIEHRYVRRMNGRVGIVRLVPDVHEERIRTADCGGCGTPRPRESGWLMHAHALGVRDPAQIDFVTRHYPYTLVIATCDHSPRP